ncbi:MAG: 3-deoxy-7-phosphoheptulonate synthase [Acidobacteriota bacterium]|nr:3-deoxy-7-phosphoheptulonate synthase [Acidobacteriota bacterium]MDQ7087969.1 3-deoxy-7-phosphoheptulonate synthase [Acidobacteriota bacterium]
MIAVLEKGCSVRVKAEIVRFIEGEGFRVQVSQAGGRSLVGVIGDGAARLAEPLAALPGVEQVRPVAPPYPMVSREHQPRSTRVKVGDVTIGGREVVVIAGPCSVESLDQLLSTARRVAAAGARLLRGGAFKPRSSPYSFQGLGEKGLELLARAREETGLGVVTEVLAPDDVELVARYADVLQVGARNMQNFRLLQAVGEQPRPVLLKRGLMATAEELLMAAEYVVASGNPRVVLCERGIRTFETATRNTLDVAAVPVVKARSHLPVIVDPSHAAGLREMVPDLALAGVAAGADGLMVEVHPEPEKALSDGRQSLTFDGFDAMMERVRRICAAVDRRLAPAAEEKSERER